MLGRQVSTIVWRTFAQSDLELMAEHAGVPVVNALTDEFHPCQLLADLLTVREHKGELAGLTLTFIGDAANNMGNSWLLACVTAGMHVRVAGPLGYWPSRGDVRAGRRHRRADRRIRDRNRRPRGGGHRRRRRRDRHLGVDGQGGRAGRARWRPLCRTPHPELLAHAEDDAIVLHCLPAYRGKEIAAEVIDGPQSVVWDEAENRRHAQKALLAFLMEQP